MNLDHTVCALSSATVCACWVRSVYSVSKVCSLSVRRGRNRCSDDSLEKTVEEARVPAFRLAEPGIAQQLTSVGERFSLKIKTVKDPAALRQLALATGLNLWAQARQDFQAGAVLDDRPLYWQRLVVAPMIRARAKQLGCKPLVIAQVMAAFEQASRGQMDVRGQPRRRAES